MTRLVLTGLVAATVAGIVGFGIGKRSTDRHREVPVPASASSSPPALSTAEKPASNATPESAPVSMPAPEAIPSPVAEPAAPPMSAKDRLFALLIPHLSEEKKHSALWGAVIGNTEAQRKLFELLMKTDDRELIEVGQDLLISIRDPELLKDVLAAYASETNRDRRALLAYALGGNAASPEVRATIQSILSAGDNVTMERVLTRLSVQGSGRDDHMDLVPQLRHLVVNGPTPEIRSKSARALRGDRTEEGIQFLIDRMLNDKDPDVSYQAMVALPVTYSGGGQHEEVQYRNLLTVALDETRSDRMRRWAADRVLMGTYRFKNLVTEEQRALVAKLAERKSEGSPQKGKP